MKKIIAVIIILIILSFLMITKFSNVVKLEEDKIVVMTLKSPGDGTYYELQDTDRIKYLVDILESTYLFKIPFKLSASTGTYNYNFFDSNKHQVFSVGFISDKLIEINGKFYYAISKIPNDEFNIETNNFKKTD